MPGLVTPSWSLRSTGSAIRRRVTRTIADLGERRITLRALREGIDTATPAGRAVAAIMATLAELELELGRERCAASRESRRSDACRLRSRQSSAPIGTSSYGRLAATGEPVRELAAGVRGWPSNRLSLPSGLSRRFRWRRPSSYLGKGWSDRVQLGPKFVDALDETIEPGVVDEVRLWQAPPVQPGAS
jgi:hypothetical protein